MSSGYERYRQCKHSSFSLRYTGAMCNDCEYNFYILYPGEGSGCGGRCTIVSEGGKFAHCSRCHLQLKSADEDQGKYGYFPTHKAMSPAK